ncbi:MAG: hypothetical protein OCD00_00715, partial [Colwellia sp.]
SLTIRLPSSKDLNPSEGQRECYNALAKLGRWYDSKGTGIVGWEALWAGWFNLTKLIEGANFMQQQMIKM